MIVNVVAVQWNRGWELHIDNVGVTQVRDLKDSSVQVRSYLESLEPSKDYKNLEVVVEKRFDADQR